jgi:hypothetical protein
MSVNDASGIVASLTDNSRGVIYDRKFIVQATGICVDILKTF